MSYEKNAALGYVKRDPPQYVRVSATPVLQIL